MTAIDPAAVTNEQIIAWCDACSHEEARKLATLLRDPHPGLTAWRSCLSDAALNLIAELEDCDLKTVLNWKVSRS